MCQSVTIDGKYTGQVQQLADYIGVQPTELVWYDDEHWKSPEEDYKFCLCPINLGATAKKFGYRCELDEYGDSVFTKKYKFNPNDVVHSIGGSILFLIFLAMSAYVFMWAICGRCIG